MLNPRNTVPARKSRAFAFNLALVVLCLAACSAPSDETRHETTKASAELPIARSDTDGSTITVLAAASTTEAMRSVCELFEELHRTPVRLSTGSSNALAQQILSGAPADIFVSANPKWVEVLDEQGDVVRSKPLLSNRLVLITSRENPAQIQGPECLARNEVQRVALAGPNVPAGRYAEEALRSVGQWSALERDKKVVRGSTVRIALAYVERQEVEAGVVYETDTRNADNVRAVFRFDESDHEPIVYPVALLEGSKGEAFYRFLDSEAARAVFRDHGFSEAVGSLSQPETVRAGR